MRKKIGYALWGLVILAIIAVVLPIIFVDIETDASTAAIQYPSYAGNTPTPIPTPRWQAEVLPSASKAIPTPITFLPTSTPIPAPTTVPTLVPVLPTPRIQSNIVPDDSTITPSNGNVAACWHFRDASRDFGADLLTTKGYVEELIKVIELTETGSQFRAFAHNIVSTMALPMARVTEKKESLFAFAKACTDAGYLICGKTSKSPVCSENKGLQ